MTTKILLIEDEDDLRFNIEEILQLNDFEVCTAANGVEGLALLQNNEFDLIISDIMMPMMDGYQVLEYVRANPRWANLPIVFLTAKVEQADFRRGMELGAEDYLSKPVMSKDLLKSIQSVLRKKTQRENLITDRVQNALQLERNVKYHELRTPLFGLMTLIEYLNSSYYEIDDEQKKYLLQKAEQSIQRLDSSLAKLNRLHNIQNPKIDKVHIPSLRFFIMEKLDSEQLEVQGDMDMYIDKSNLKFVLEELLENASKFSYDPSEVKILMSENSFLIKNGQGNITIPGPLSPKPFLQMNREYHEQQGLGLGLFLASEYLNNNGYVLKAWIDEEMCFNVLITP
jgi:two-component system, sensor histidine kinase and response regulator